VVFIGPSGKCRAKTLKCYCVYSSSFMVYNSPAIHLFITYAADRMSVKNEKNKILRPHKDERWGASDEGSDLRKVFTNIEEQRKP
jgi:hypothetical protein